MSGYKHRKRISTGFRLMLTLWASRDGLSQSINFEWVMFPDGRTTPVKNLVGRRVLAPPSERVTFAKN